MNFNEYGNKKGKTVIYFHGVPGSPEECDIFDEHAKEHNLHIICYDRFSVDASLTGATYFQYLADTIKDKAKGGQVDIIGFSIGCHVAIETSLYLQGYVRSLHLISSVAPLDAGDFIEGMAGKWVFSIAKNYPVIFTALSYWQSLLSKRAPGVLFNMLFSSAAGEDSLLSKNSEFESFMIPILKQGFGANIKGYIRDINQYITPWQDAIFKCTVNTTLWHGSSDNWSPVGMAHYLEENIQASAVIELMEGLSHYSCLYDAAPKICAQLAETPLNVIE